MLDSQCQLFDPCGCGFADRPVGGVVFVRGCLVGPNLARIGLAGIIVRACPFFGVGVDVSLLRRV